LDDDKLGDEELDDDKLDDEELEDDELKDDELEDDELKDDELEVDELKDDELEVDELEDDELEVDELEDDEFDVDKSYILVARPIFSPNAQHQHQEPIPAILDALSDQLLISEQLLIVIEGHSVGFRWWSLEKSWYLDNITEHRLYIE